ncbi:hypothetical protein VaNZ11_009048 [Volvox africanus]|uniref:Neurochondrin n=1 Tax=Volvox africanus TaxID=51714 RepID=A0ABQ5S6J7_9CHLO|nr:hypothetical protein VaNZ11_009048 [Volvox africanus]
MEISAEANDTIGFGKRNKFVPAIPSAGENGPECSQDFQQCLELLRGPGDERRFVGLLLVTRLLPHGSDDAVRKVLEALGAQFLHRLLLPLRKPAQGPQVSAEAKEQQATGCSLALAILAAGCRLHDFAAGPDVRDLLPVLLKVVQHGGVSRILQLSTAPADGGVRDAAAVSDALECLLGAAAAAPEQTLTILERSPLMESLASWLTTAAAALTSAPPGASGIMPTDEAQTHGSVLLAAALLERALTGGSGSRGKGGGRDGGGRGQGIVVFAEHSEASAHVMVALATLLGNPRLLDPLPAVTQGSVIASQAAQGPQSSSHAEGNPHPVIRGTEASDGSSAAATAATGSRGVSGGAAQLQLEALHLLLLMLRACQEPAAAAAARELVRLDEQVAWSAAVRRGLGWLLRSRAPGTLKHLALQMAAVVAETVGDGWLLGSRAAAAAAALDSEAPPRVPPPLLQQQQQQPPMAQEEPGSFLLLLVETLKIETGLLLQDALHPDRHVPATISHRSSTLRHAAPPTPSQQLLDELAARAAQRKAAEEAAARAAVGVSIVGGGAVPGPASSAKPLPPLAAAATEATTEMEVDGASVFVELPSDMQEGRGVLPDSAAAANSSADSAMMPAGQRALLLLPAAFRLLEGSVEAVAADAAAADEYMEAEFSEPTSSARSSPGHRQPVLSDAALQKLMSAFNAIIETLLQFFENAHEQQQNQQLEAAPATVTGTSTLASAATGAVPSAVLLGAARVFGRYLAEAPDAVRSAPVLQALPFVMGLRSGHQEGRACNDDDDNNDDNDDMGNFALTFLLPGLLLATGPGADGRFETTRALRTSPSALSACVAYLAHCVRGAVAATPLAERLLKEAEGGGSGSGGGGGGCAAALEALVRFERGMADVSMLLLNILEPGNVLSGLPAARHREAAEGHYGDNTTAATAATAAETWKVLEHSFAMRGRHADAATSINAAAAAAAAAAPQHLPPLLVQLLPICWLMEQWAWARENALRDLSFLDPLRPSSAVHVLFRWQLGTRALLCAACLPVVVLLSNITSLAATAASCGHGSALRQNQQRKDADANAHPDTDTDAEVVKVTACLLPQSIVERVVTAALAAAAGGTSLQLAAQLPPPPGFTRNPLLPMTPEGLADDVRGDGEVCWERLLAACVQLLEVSPPVRCLMALVSGRGASWLEQLLGAHARREPAAEELLLSEVNLARLLQLVLGASTTGV